jgi:ferredoxin--NADP+ reductase
MTRPGTEVQPLRVAIVGSGPAGFYTADRLFRQPELAVQVDMYDRLPVPYGLVRFGVAPDRERIKNVTRVFEKTAAHPSFRFFGNVEVGTHVTISDLRLHYHQICCATGAQNGAMQRSISSAGTTATLTIATSSSISRWSGWP